MKKTLKTVAFLLVAAIFINTFALFQGSLAGAVKEEFSPLEFSDAFNYGSFQEETIFDLGVWAAENPSSGNSANFTAVRPVVENGVLKVNEGMSAQFNWTKLEGFTFDKSKTYTLKFDLKVTDFGDDIGIRDVWKREFYFAPGGWFNQIELISDNGDKSIRTGDTYKGAADYKKDTVYSVTVVWEPFAKKITSSVSIGDTLVSSGYRTNDAYASANNQLSNWIMRCEDGAFEIDNLSYTDGTVEYTQSFGHAEAGGSAASKGIWSVESHEKGDALPPKIMDGVLKLSEKESAAFNWTAVSGAEVYDPQNTYTFEFDFKITDSGDGSNWNNSAHTRALYVAMGGYYNQIELPTESGKVRAGDSYAALSAEYVNKPLRARVVWEGTMITSYIFDESGKLLLSGSRTNSSYTDVTHHNKAMTYLVMRCEDGAVNVDNFKFKIERFEKAASEKLEMTAGKSAVYQCTIQSANAEKAVLKINNTEVVSISAGRLALCGSVVNGSYGAGEYGVKIYVNKEQKLLMTEVTLPGGGSVRRGTYAVIDMSAKDYSIDLYADSKECVKNVEVKYTDNNVNDYELTELQPVYKGFNANVYNLISAFDDPKTTRSFAWTALESYIGSDDMAIKYRVKGETEWNIAVAVKEKEGVENKTENYYKADITGLASGCEYEYRVGKKNGESETDDWSKIYTFKTSAEDVTEFSFVALGDTQGITWNGTSGADKGFMFAKAAYEAAMKEVPDAAFILHTGDVVENGDNNKQWNMFFKALGEIGASTPHFAAIGNHDTVRLNGQVPEFYFDLHFNHPDNGGTARLDKTQTNKITNYNLAGIAADADETFYSFDYGNAHFIVLNSGNYSGEDKYILEAQRKWLEADLKANACSKWTVITVHEPVYHRLGGSESRPWLYDLIEEYKVDLLIQGHSHLVTRTYPMKDGAIVTKESIDVIKQGSGTVYTTVGSTAYNHDSMGNPNVEECAVIATTSPEQPTYTVVKVSGDSLTMTVKQANGLTVDSFTITADEEKAEHKGSEEIVNKKDATCGEEGYTGDTVCSVCKEIFKKGEIIAKNDAHTFGEFTVRTEATATENGEEFRACATCGYEETREIPATGATVTKDTSNENTNTPGSSGDSSDNGDNSAAKSHNDSLIILIVVIAAIVAIGAGVTVFVLIKRKK